MKKLISGKLKKLPIIGISAALSFLIPLNLVSARAFLKQDSSEKLPKPLPSIFERNSTNSSENKKVAKPRIAVLDFDYSNVSSPYVYQFMQSRGVSDILVNRLVKTRKYRVIERSQIEAAIAEQNLGASGRIDTATAAKIGKLLGVKYLIYGSVTRFDVEKKTGGVRVFGFGNRTSDSAATVQLNVRVVDTETGEIIGVAEASESSTSADDSVSVFGVTTNSSTSNDGKLLSSATVAAVEQIVEELGSQI